MVTGPSSSSERMFFGGFASGLDTAGIIDALTAVQRRPIQLAEARLAQVEAKRSALSQVNSSLANLLGTLDALRKPDTIGARAAAVSNTDDAAKLAVSAGTTAAIGSFTVDILSLATSTKARSTSAIGAGIDAAAALDEAGFATALTAGTFSINGTAFTIPEAGTTALASNGAIGATVSTSAALQDAGLSIAPAASGTFTINGASISYDAANDTLAEVVTRINQSAAGVTATFDAGTQTLSLSRTEHGPDAITVSDTSGNFLQAMNLVDGANAPIGVETLGSDYMSLDDVVSMINGASIGVTASIENEAYGRPNLLQMSSGSAVQLGSGADTSNFLAITHLLQSPGGTSRTSVRSLGTVDTAANLADARLATALDASGEFTVNGISITYDAAADSLNSVISRINQSGAGVTASYDAYNDQLVFTANATGSLGIALDDVSGNFLAATSVLAASQTLGTSSSYKVNDGPVQYATTNQVNDAVPGVSLTLKQVTTSPITVNVAADTASVRTKIEKFVEQFNSTMTLMREATKYVEDGPSGALVGDSSLRNLERSLRSMVGGIALGATGDLRTLADLGLTFGAVGSAVGTTNTLAFDAGKFNDTLTSNPEGVARLLTHFSGTPSLEGTSSGSLTGISGTPSTATDSGKYVLTSASNGDLTMTFTPDNGGTAVVRTATISPGEVNSTLIPGMTLTFAGTLVDGTDTITVAASEEGIAKALHEYVDSYTRAGGVMSGRDAEMQSRITAINEQIETMEARVATRRDRLIRQYANLEVTMQRLQQQQAALGGLVQQLAANKRSA